MFIIINVTFIMERYFKVVYFFICFSLETLFVKKVLRLLSRKNVFCIGLGTESYKIFFKSYMLIITVFKLYWPLSNTNLYLFDCDLLKRIIAYENECNVPKFVFSNKIALEFKLINVSMTLFTYINNYQNYNF